MAAADHHSRPFTDLAGRHCAPSPSRFFISATTRSGATTIIFQHRSSQHSSLHLFASRTHRSTCRPCSCHHRQSCCTHHTMLDEPPLQHRWPP
ncbi:hypothetical protein DEO72_LG8g2035 [Vigna unguiculata]|uniref:Uncharacterized protein n=1 Tax=Vigna unguiculata TaxID=3917 RepID=A0A4D6MRG5_VIGUN|nr:hypothetical protein DEO72_LG8g2035 [Vigna unguiculata]